MPRVEEFESGQDPSPQVIEGFVNMLKALRYDQEVAENIFARTAKREVGLHLGKMDFRRLTSNEARGRLPLWVASSSVSIQCLGKEEDSSGQVTSLIRLIDTLVATMQSTLSTLLGELILIDALSTDIHSHGGDIFKFTLKQKWTFE